MTFWAGGLSYRGSRYYGWQLQNDVVTVQAELERALSTIANHPIRVHAAGRTDRGVHATGQVFGFTSHTERDAETWLRGANGLTPDSIRIDWLQEVDECFHARFSAVARRYHFIYMDEDRFADPTLADQVWHCGELDADAMHRAAQALVGEHDFSAFRAAGCQSNSPIRRINYCRVWRDGALVALEIEANAFLLHMVRNIATLLCDVGAGKAVRPVNELLAAGDRKQIGATAPAAGLYLSGVRYPNYAFPPARVPVLIRTPEL